MNDEQLTRDSERMVKEVDTVKRVDARLEAIQEEIARLQQQAETLKSEGDAALAHAVELAAINNLDADLEDELGYMPEELRDLDAFDVGRHRFSVGDEVTVFSDAKHYNVGRIGDGTIVRITRDHVVVELEAAAGGVTRVSVKREHVSQPGIRF